MPVTSPARGFAGALAAILLFAAPLAALGAPDPADDPAQRSRRGIPGAELPTQLLTADIQAGIEKHIADTKARNDGFFPIQFNGDELRLKLVRVHTEYLANLGPGRHFACVDLATIDGRVFDVDFFLQGEPGAMTVTETSVHKLNGVPYYLWKQNEDATWRREPVEEATDALMGVVRERDAFEFQYDAVVPALTGPARLWMPIPSTDQFQTVTLQHMTAPGRRQSLTDNRGNRVVLLSLEPQDAGKPISVRVVVERIETGPYADPASPADAYLAPELLVPDAPAFHKAASEATAGKTGDLVKARAIYDHTIDTFQYKRYGEGWGKGDALRACDARSGNCTDFHAYFIAVARAAGIPARFAIGAAIPSDRDEGGVDGYHCWAEFFAEGKWWPVDLSEANKFSPLSTY